MATAPSPNDLTRQQLDELDALLQKMLTVPLSVDTPAPAASLPAMAQPPLPPSWRIDPPQVPDGFGATRSSPPAPAPSMAVSFAEISLDDPPPSLKFEPPAPAPVPKAAKPAPAPVPAPAPKPVPPPAPAPKPAPPAVKVAPAPVPAPAPKPKQVPPPQPKAVPASAAPAPAGITPPPAQPVPLLFLPLVALEGVFDGICGMFGPPGRLLRSGFFKHLYGFAGLGLVAYTALRVAQVQGLVALPVALPWPK